MLFYVPIGCVRFARYYGKMYSCHLFPYGGKGVNFHFVVEYFVKVTEIISGHKVTTKRTSTTDGDIHPVFNAKLSFQVSLQQLSHTSLVLTLVGRGKMRSNKSVGRAILGPSIFASDSERNHWGRMIISPMKTVEQWHALYL